MYLTGDEIQKYQATVTKSLDWLRSNDDKIEKIFHAASGCVSLSFLCTRF